MTTFLYEYTIRYDTTHQEQTIWQRHRHRGDKAMGRAHCLGPHHLLCVLDWIWKIRLGHTGFGCLRTHLFSWANYHKIRNNSIYGAIWFGKPCQKLWSSQCTQLWQTVDCL